MDASIAEKLIDGKSIAASIHQQVETEVRALREVGRIPHLVALQVGEDPATDVYVRKQREGFLKLGIQYTHVQLDASTSKAALIDQVDGLNANPTVTGIIATMPLPEGIPARELQERIDPAKDVEGVHPENLGRLIYDRHGVGPCTALAVMTAIDSTGVSVEGKHVVMVGHSDIVGKPVGLCLLHEMATMTTCHAATVCLEEHTRQADILVVAVGKPGLLRGDMVREGTIVIDVGINRVEGPPPRTVGDVDFDSVAPKASAITPVPGGIGPITVAMLARNTLRCAKRVLAR